MSPVQYVPGGTGPEDTMEFGMYRDRSTTPHLIAFQYLHFTASGAVYRTYPYELLAGRKDALINGRESGISNTI
jgi:hypothetical protein